MKICLAKYLNESYVVTGDVNERRKRRKNLIGNISL